MKGAIMATEMRQLTLMKKGHYYVFRYQPGEEAQMIDTLMGKAHDPNCPLDWFDAAVLSHQMGHRMASEMQTILKSKFGVMGNMKKAADAT